MRGRLISFEADDNFINIIYLNYGICLRMDMPRFQ